MSNKYYFITDPAVTDKYVLIFYLYSNEAGGNTIKSYTGFGKKPGRAQKELMHVRFNQTI